MLIRRAGKGADPVEDPPGPAAELSFGVLSHSNGLLASLQSRVHIRSTDS